MTSQSLNTDKKRASFYPFFSFTARQFWTTALLFGIILFFLLPVPVMMTISERRPIEATDIERIREMFEEDWIFTIRYFTIICLSIFGVVTSCSRFAYLKNKVSVDFYHSLPVKRGQLFLTQTVTSAIAVVIPYIINIAITVIVLAVNELLTATALVNILSMSAQAFIFSAFFFALSTLIGMISGLGAVQLTLTVIATFIIPAVYALSVVFVGIFNENMWQEFYLGTKFFEYSSPVFRLMLNESSLSIFEAFSFLLVTAAMLVAAYAIYMKRKSERAGTPVVFTTLGEVIKYILVFVGTIGLGLIFYAIMSTVSWMMFGMVCGAVLVFMLTNTILHKTARAMFKGWKGLCIYGACATAAFIIFVTNAFGINTYVPTASQTARVSVNFDDVGGTMEFTDKDVIDAIRTIYTDGENVYSNYMYSSILTPSYDYEYKYYTNSLYIEMVFYPKVGVPVAKTVRLYDRYNFIDEFRTILDSKEFAQQYATALEDIKSSGHTTLMLSHLNFPKDGIPQEYYSKNRSWSFKEFSLTDSRAKELGLDIVADYMKDVNFDYFQQQTFGYFDIYNSGNTFYQLDIPLFTSMAELQEHYVDEGYLTSTQDQMLEKLANAIDSIQILHMVGDVEKSMTVTDKAQILEILTASSNPLGREYSAFTFVDTSYKVMYTIREAEASYTTYYYDENGIEHEEIVDVEITDANTFTTDYSIVFLLGRVPDFVIEYFAK